MLVLTRRIGEALVIGNDITFTVLDLKGNQVRIGVNAPRNVPVHREEIYRRLRLESDTTVSFGKTHPVVALGIKLKDKFKALKD